MSRKIMILCGSPRRRGDTNWMVAWFAKGTSAAGAIDGGLTSRSG